VRGVSGGSGKRTRVVTYLPPPMVSIEKENEKIRDVKGPSDGVEHLNMEAAVLTAGSPGLREEATQRGEAGIDQQRRREEDDDKVSAPHHQDTHASDPTVSHEHDNEPYHQSSSSPPPHRDSSPTLLNSSPPSDVHISIKIDDITSKYPRTRMMMSEVRMHIPPYVCGSMLQLTFSLVAQTSFCTTLGYP